MSKKIYLSSKKYPGYYALVDDEDYEWLNQWRWFIRKDLRIKNRELNYAYRTFYYEDKPRKNINMHSLIMNTPKNMVTDHINGNGLDNRKSNLRIVTKRQNGQNYHFKSISKYPGVRPSKYGRWRSQIKLNGKQKDLGTYDTEIEAYLKYKEACKLIDEDRIDEIENIIVHPKYASKYVGVTWYAITNRWRARICINGETKYLGYFKDEYDAHLAYEKAKKEAQTNQNGNN